MSATGRFPPVCFSARLRPVRLRAGQVSGTPRTLVPGGSRPSCPPSWKSSGSIMPPGMICCGGAGGSARRRARPSPGSLRRPVGVPATIAVPEAQDLPALRSAARPAPAVVRSSACLWMARRAPLSNPPPPLPCREGRRTYARERRCRQSPPTHLFRSGIKRVRPGRGSRHRADQFDRWQCWKVRVLFVPCPCAPPEPAHARAQAASSPARRRMLRRARQMRRRLNFLNIRFLQSHRVPGGVQGRCSPRAKPAASDGFGDADPPAGGSRRLRDRLAARLRGSLPTSSF